MKKLNITKEAFERSNYFTKKYGKLKYVSESGKLFKTDKGKVLMFKEDAKGKNELSEDAILDAIPVDARDGLIDINEPDGSFGRYTWYVKFAPFSEDEAKVAADGITKSTGRRTTVASSGREVFVLVMDYPSRPASESRKLVKEGAGAGYTVTLKNVKLTNAKVINRTEDGDWEFEADIVKDTYMVEAEDYYNRFCPINEYDEEWVEVAGKVKGVCWWYEDEMDVERQIRNTEQDIGFDYGAGWVHANLPKDGHIVADRVRADEHDTWAITSIELDSPQLAESVNYCHEHFLDDDDEPMDPDDELNQDLDEVDESASGFKVGDKVKVVGRGLASKNWIGTVVKVNPRSKWEYVVGFPGREDGEYSQNELELAGEVDESRKVVKEYEEPEPTIKDIFKALHHEYDGKMFSDNFLKANVYQPAKDEVIVYFDCEKPEDFDEDDPNEQSWWEDKVDSTFLFYTDILQFLKGKFGEMFNYEEPRGDMDFDPNPRGKFKVGIDENDNGTCYTWIRLNNWF